MTSLQDRWPSIVEGFLDELDQRDTRDAYFMVKSVCRQLLRHRSYSDAQARGEVASMHQKWSQSAVTALERGELHMLEELQGRLDRDAASRDDKTAAQAPGVPRPAIDGQPGRFSRRDEANAIVAYAFRNGPIENLHAGKYSKLLEDSSLCRITDPEMKSLMLSACEKMEELLRLKESEPDKYEKTIRWFNSEYCKGWDR